MVVDRVGNIKMQGLNKVLSEDEMVGYMNQRLIYLAEKVLREDEQVVLIVDLSGKIMQLASKKILDALERVISNASKFFPLMLHSLIFVNTPMLFDTIWTKISLCLILLPLHAPIHTSLIFSILQFMLYFNVVRTNNDDKKCIVQHDQQTGALTTFL